MMKKCALALLVAVSMLGCGDDDEKTLIKWDCTGDCQYSYACAATASDAISGSGCTYSSSSYYGSSPAKCVPLGDLCACPDGASSCGIASGN